MKKPTIEAAQTPVAPATEEKKKSTRQHLKPTGKTCLYRHDVTGVYYGIKKHKGKIPSASLKTDDRKIAEARLKDWIEGLDTPESNKPPTLEKLFATFKETKKGNEEGTHDSYEWVLKTFKKHGGKKLLAKLVTEIKPSELDIFCGQFEKIWKATSYNNMTLIVKQVFDVAFKDQIIKQNPYHLMTKKRVKVIPEPAQVPTLQQCDKIVESIRNQPFADTRERSADLCEFLHRAALGEAEAGFLKWENVDWNGGEINAKRKKTGVFFQVPLYLWLKPFMVALYKKQGKPQGTAHIFNIKSIKQALYNACERLGYVAYSPRDLRKARIVDMLRNDIPAEDIAEYQGHKDNGVLIRRTYAWVIDESGKQHRRAKLAEKFAHLVPTS